MERKVAFLPFGGTNCLIPYGRTENVVENCTNNRHRKLKQMTKDLVMHPSYEELIVLLKSEKNKIIRMNSSFH
jgi:hypothetical protein